METADFVKFPKIPRQHGLYMLITEKLDGTNAQIVVPEDPAQPVLAGSRNRWITPEKDNYGFASWVHANMDALRRLGPGRHFGEWWGCGIGPRGYGLHSRRWSLFNAERWQNREGNATSGLPAGLPDNVGCVPILYKGKVEFGQTDRAILQLLDTGSVAAPGYRDPEGIVVRVGSTTWKCIIEKRGPSPEEP